MLIFSSISVALPQSQTTACVNEWPCSFPAVSLQAVSMRGYSRRADRAEETELLHKQALPDLRYSAHPSLQRTAALRKSLQKHNPPHSSKTNVLGHPNFSISLKGGQEMDVCRFASLYSQTRRGGFGGALRLRLSRVAVFHRWRHKWWSSSERACSWCGACLLSACQSTHSHPPHTTNQLKQHAKVSIFLRRSCYRKYCRTTFSKGRPGE